MSVWAARRAPDHHQIRVILSSVKLETDGYARSALEPGRLDTLHDPMICWDYADVSPEWVQTIELRTPRRFLSTRAYRSLYLRYRTDTEVALLQLPSRELPDRRLTPAGEDEPRAGLCPSGRR
ncbi:MAG: hypothetical protein ACI8S6_000016 [Myxococcota bacterium]|jgi:hypothetical protein